MNIFSKVGGLKKRYKKLDYEKLAVDKYNEVVYQEQEKELRAIANKLDSLGTVHLEYDVQIQQQQVNLDDITNDQLAAYKKSLLDVKTLQQNYITQLSELSKAFQEQLDVIESDPISDALAEKIRDYFDIHLELENLEPETHNQEIQTLKKLDSQLSKINVKPVQQIIKQTNSLRSVLERKNTGFPLKPFVQKIASTDNIPTSASAPTPAPTASELDSEVLIRSIDVLKRENFELKLRTKDLVLRNKNLRIKAVKHIKLLEDVIYMTSRPQCSCQPSNIVQIWEHLQTNDNHDRSKCVICQTYDLSDTALLP